MSLLSFFLWIGTILACFNSAGNSPLSMRELKFLAINLAIKSLFSLVILVGISSWWQDFLILKLLIIFLTSLQLALSEIKGWFKRFSLKFGFTWVFIERFNYRHNRIKIFTYHWKRLRFWDIQTGYYIKEKLIKRLTELLVTSYGFTIINKINFFTFWWILGK